jgi:D-alanyl-D-alanine dipeptidase
MSARRFWAIAISIAASIEAMGAELPAGFVYLSEVAPTIRQDIRYAGSHNFTGRPVDGYQANECILSAWAAKALQRVQAELAGKNLSLIVWDCYRPMRAVRDFITWSRSQQAPVMKAEFFPNTEKSRFFILGYLASHSAHSRGSTVDLGIVPSTVQTPPVFDGASPLVPCTASKDTRFNDGTIDLGTGYDCLDPLASTNNPGVGKEARANRILLQRLMQQHGFKSYSREWWHFELADAPFAGQDFDFPITPRNASTARPSKAPALSAIWMPFRKAVLERDAAAVAKMASFPLSTARGEMDAEAFVANFEPIFDGALTACIATGAPEPSAKAPETDFAVRCSKNKYDNALQFHKQTDGNWQLATSIGGDSTAQNAARSGGASSPEQRLRSN